jgi:hypothetical protein
MSTKRQNHSWGPPTRFGFKTERACKKCPIVKVTRHETDISGPVHWTEFWNGLDKIEGKGTPACVEVLVEVGRAAA